MNDYPHAKALMDMIKKKSPSVTYAQLLDGVQHTHLKLRYRLALIRENLSSMQADLHVLDLFNAYHNLTVLQAVYDFIDPLAKESSDPVVATVQSLEMQGGLFLARYQPQDDMGSPALLKASAPHLLKIMSDWMDGKQPIDIKEVAGLFMFFQQYIWMTPADTLSKEQFVQGMEGFLREVELKAAEAERLYALHTQRYS